MTSEDPSKFAHMLMTVLDLGKRTGTHKLVMLLALMRAIERATADGGGTVPSRVPVSLVADEVFRVMWRQIGPYVPPASSGAVELRHMAGRSSTMASLVEEAHGLGTSWDRVVAQDAVTAGRLRERMEDVLCRYPLDRFQNVGSDTVEFLYRWNHTSLSRARIAADQGWEEPQVIFVEGASTQLLQFGAIIRPLVERKLVGEVARYSQLDVRTQQLHDRLFPATRFFFPKPVAEVLYEIQGGRCLYCPGSVPLPTPASGQVDHFVPWSRFPNDAFENLALTHPSCNGSKNDLSASGRHIAAWAGSYGPRMERAVQLSADGVIAHDPRRTLGLVRTSYELLPEGFPLWDGHRTAPTPFDVGQRDQLDAAVAHITSLLP